MAKQQTLGWKPALKIAQQRRGRRSARVKRCKILGFCFEFSDISQLLNFLNIFIFSRSAIEIQRGGGPPYFRNPCFFYFFQKFCRPLKLIALSFTKAHSFQRDTRQLPQCGSLYFLQKLCRPYSLSHFLAKLNSLQWETRQPLRRACDAERRWRNSFGAVTMARQQTVGENPVLIIALPRRGRFCSCRMMWSTGFFF